MSFWRQNNMPFNFGASASVWVCPNGACELHRKRQHLGPGNRLTTWTCRKCNTELEAIDL